MNSLTHSSIHSLNQFTHSFIHSLTHSFTHSFIHSLIHSLTHSFIHSLFIFTEHLLKPRHLATHKGLGCFERPWTTGFFFPGWWVKGHPCVAGEWEAGIWSPGPGGRMCQRNGPNPETCYCQNLLWPRADQAASSVLRELMEGVFWGITHRKG